MTVINSERHYQHHTSGESCHMVPNRAAGRWTVTAEFKGIDTKPSYFDELADATQWYERLCSAMEDRYNRVTDALKGIL